MTQTLKAADSGYNQKACFRPVRNTKMPELRFHVMLTSKKATVTFDRI